MIKIIAHDTTMEIPIFNSLYLKENKKIKSRKINFSKLNELDFSEIDKNKFPSVNFKVVPSTDSLFETVLVTCNDELVKKFLNHEISYDDIYLITNKILKRREFVYYKKVLPSKVSEVVNLSNYVRKRINGLYI